MWQLLKGLFFILLTTLVINNTYKIHKQPNIYINNEVIDAVKNLDYRPEELLNANVVVQNNVGMGSGSVIKVDNTGTLILTVAHVIREKRYYVAKGSKLEWRGIVSKNIDVIHNGKKYKAIPIKVSTELDLAVIKIYKKLDTVPVKIAKDAPKLGETVWAVSNPGGVPNIINKGVYNSEQKNNAIVSVGGYFGSSGGMVVNTSGEQIGVIQSVYITTISGFFPAISTYNGISKTKILKRFLKGVL
jgi:S1-C subfamily serine protease